MSDTTLHLTIVETIHYGADFTLDELNALCIKHGIAPYDPDGETGDITAWLQDEVSEVLLREDAQSNILDEIEHNSGDVQSQEWKWEVSR